MLGSVAVIAGLALSALGYAWGDAAAAIGVALVISVLGLRLTRSTVETLLDRAPDGVAEKATAAIKSLPGVVDVVRLRARMVGPTHFIDTAADAGTPNRYFVRAIIAGIGVATIRCIVNDVAEGYDPDNNPPGRYGEAPN